MSRCLKLACVLFASERSWTFETTSDGCLDEAGCVTPGMLAWLNHYYDSAPQVRASSDAGDP